MTSSVRRKRIIRAIQLIVSLVIVVGIFVGILPKIADYSDVWATIKDLTPIEVGTLFAMTVFNIFTYWPQMMAAMPGLTLAQAAVNNQTSTTIANTLPGGGAIAVGVSYTMFRSWGFSNGEIALLSVVTGVWNTFIKLAMPVAAIALLAITGTSSAGLLIPAVIGVVVLAAAVVAFGLMLWKKEFAEAIGGAVGRVATRVRSWAHKPPVASWGEGAVRFRSQTISLLSRRWLALTITTVVSHLGLYFVLFLALRHVGVSEREVSWVQILGVFSFVRLISAVPILPGGLGIVELGYIGGLVLAGRHHADVTPELFRAQVAAAVLVFRALTYVLQIPLGGFTYLIWQAKKSWRKTPPDSGAPVTPTHPEPVAP